MTDVTKTTRTIASEVLRGRLEQVRARYGSGTVPRALFEALKALEREIAWTEFKAGKQ
jgi:hypothetical protein